MNNIKEHEKTQLLSVIISVYNVEQFLSRCIESVLELSQTHDLEIIIVNDGSTDKSLKIAEEYALKSSNVLIKSIANSGLPNARNIGLDAARGKWVWFCDSDDYIDPEAFRFVVDSFLTEQIDVLSFAVASSEQANANVENTEKSHKCDILYEGDGLEYLKNHKMPFVWNKIYKRDLIGDLRFKDYVRFEDIAFNIDIFIKQPYYRAVNTIVYRYNTQNEGSITRQRNPKVMRTFVDNYMSFFAQLHDYGEKDESLKPILLDQGSNCAVKFVSRLLSAKYSREEMKTIVQRLKSVGFFPFVEKTKLQKASNCILRSTILYAFLCPLYNYVFVPFILPRLSRFR